MILQMSVLPEAIDIDRSERLEKAIDTIRNRFGFTAVKRAVMMTDTVLSGMDAKTEHVIHPVSLLR